MNARSSCSVRSSPVSRISSAMSSSIGLEPGSGTAGATFTSKARALAMMWHTLSGSMVGITAPPAAHRRTREVTRWSRRLIATAIGSVRPSSVLGGLARLRSLALALAYLGAAQVLLVLRGAFLVRGTGLAQCYRHGLLAALDLLT